jgi:hypothetical protein
LDQSGASTPEKRKAILVQAFAECLKKLGAYDYVAETTVLRPTDDRPLYCLFYATRHKTGIEVFRDSQVKALVEQSTTRASTKLKHTETKTGQIEFFESLNDMGPEDLVPFLRAQRSEAEKTFLRLIPRAPNALRYDQLWPEVLAQHVVKHADVNQFAARLRAEQQIIFPDWEPGKRVPQPHYRVHRA